MKTKTREISAIILALFLLTAICEATAYLLIPPRTAFGLNWSSYELEPKHSLDVLYLGSSIAYCDVCPALVYENTGLSGYVVAGPEQTMAMSYYYLRQALKNQSPKAVALELSGMFFNYYGEFADANASYLPFGREKLGAIFSAAAPQSRLELLFPILAYHDRSYSVTPGDIKERLDRKQDICAGYTALTAAGEPEKPYARNAVTDVYYEQALEYLEKISALCGEADITLYVYLAPALGRVDGEPLERLEADLASMGVAGYMDFSHGEAFERIGLDPAADWTDGLHLNLAGARKFSTELAEFIGATKPSGRADTALWQRRAEFINSL